MSPPRGLTSEEAAARLARVGPNAVAARPEPAALVFLRKLWGPVPWMLEAALGLQLALGKRVEAGLLVVLLLLNASLAFAHERRARRALALLGERLRVLARVLRDGAWSTTPAERLVPGDVVHVRVGDFVPADLLLSEGAVTLDQSMLTGESAPVEAAGGAAAPSGAIVRRGEATGEVVATGVRTVFGKTVSLLQVARSRSHLEGLIGGMVKAFVSLDGVLAAGVLAVALWRGEPLVEAIPFVSMLLIASVPVALPAMFTLASAVGAAELARGGVLVTRLAALEEVAAVDVLCSDKTGTVTQNRLTLVATRAVDGRTEREVIELAAAASDPATQDPIDLAILEAARARGLPAAEQLEVTPFDPSTKRAEARVRRAGSEVRVVKGAPAVIQALASGEELTSRVSELAELGCRVLAVAADDQGNLRLVGLVGLLDPPRPDSGAIVARLRELGVRVLLVTGDSAATGAAVARAIGVGERVAAGVGVDPLAADVLAGVSPEDKYRLVEALQGGGHVVAMTGDGVNDAPALKQADVGVAVSTAVDVAKSAASVVLTDPGLGGVLVAIDVGRRIYQRLLTYTLNMSVKKLEIPVFLAVGFLALGTYVVTPRLLLLLMVANDLSTMALAGDRVEAAPRPEQWRTRALVLGALGVGLPWLGFAVAAFAAGQHLAHLPVGAAQTLGFLALVYMGQANVYLLRARGPLWRSPPGPWMLVASLVTLVAATAAAVLGVLMAPLDAGVVLALLVAVVGLTLGLDLAKVRLLHRLRPPDDAPRGGGGPRVAGVGVEPTSSGV